MFFYLYVLFIYNKNIFYLTGFEPPIWLIGLKFKNKAMYFTTEFVFSIFVHENSFQRHFLLFFCKTHLIPTLYLDLYFSIFE